MQQRPGGYANANGLVRGQVQRRGLITSPLRGETFGPQVVPVPVRFGAGGLISYLERTLPGGAGYPNSLCWTIIAQGTLVQTPVTNECFYSLAGGQNPNGLRLTRNGIPNIIGTTPAGTISDPVNPVATGQAYTLIYQGAVGGLLARFWVWGSGTLLATATATTTALNIATAPSARIGARTAGEANAATTFYLGNYVTVRMWLTNAANVINLTDVPYAATTFVNVVTTATNFTTYNANSLAGGAPLYPGLVLTAAGGGQTATVLTYNSTTGALTCTPWSSAYTPAQDDVIDWTVPVEPLQLANATAATTADLGAGAIAGQLPDVFFGNGQSLAGWQAGVNKGVMAGAWTTVNLTAG